MLVDTQTVPVVGSIPTDFTPTHPAVSMAAVASQAAAAAASHGFPPNHPWDINDSALPLPDKFDKFQPWPHGHCRYVYSPQEEDGRRHVSGWAMRNTNNHNALILKKSCLGVLVCSQDCQPDSGEKVHLRPAICDKARRKQIGKPCPNSKCSGRLELLACRGHCGYPVTHFWRHAHGAIYFQAKGYHDHPRPELKSVAESRRGMSATRHYKSFMVSGMFGCDMDRKRVMTSEPEAVPSRKSLATLPGEDILCSCPPFECTCIKSGSAYKPFRPPPDPIKDSFPPPLPITQINITNACPPQTRRPCLDLFLRGSAPSLPSRSAYSVMDSSRFANSSFPAGHGLVNIRGSTHNPASAFEVPSCRQRASAFTNCSTYVPTSGSGMGAHVGAEEGVSLCDDKQRISSSRSVNEERSSASQPLLFGSRVSDTSSTFLHSSTEALFEGPSRMEELCSVPEVKEERQDAGSSSAFCPVTRTPDTHRRAAASCSRNTAPSLDSSRHLTSVVSSANDALYPLEDTSSLTHLLTSQSPQSLLHLPEAGTSCNILTSPSDSQASSTTSSDKYFEELRPVQQKEFPGQQAPRTAYDVLHHPFPREDLLTSTLTPARPGDTTTGVTFSGQQDTPYSMMPPRSEPPVMQYPGMGDVGSSWLGRYPGDCYQLSPSSQPYSSIYKQACNHSINITLTYN